MNLKYILAAALFCTTASAALQQDVPSVNDASFPYLVLYLNPSSSGGNEPAQWEIAANAMELEKLLYGHQSSGFSLLKPKHADYYGAPGKIPADAEEAIRKSQIKIPGSDLKLSFFRNYSGLRVGAIWKILPAGTYIFRSAFPLPDEDTVNDEIVISDGLLLLSGTSSASGRVNNVWIKAVPFGRQPVTLFQERLPDGKSGYLRCKVDRTALTAVIESEIFDDKEPRRSSRTLNMRDLLLGHRQELSGGIYDGPATSREKQP